jgi:hypothetical protein
MCTKAADTLAWPTGIQLQNLRIEGIKSLVHFQVQVASPNTHLETVKGITVSESYNFTVPAKGVELNKLLG